MKFITILITIITSCISLSAYESREELIAAYDKELDALVEKSLSFSLLSPSQELTKSLPRASN